MKHEIGCCVYAYISENRLWAGEPALWLRALTAHGEDLNLISKTYSAAHNHLSFNSRGSDTLFWPPHNTLLPYTKLKIKNKCRVQYSIVNYRSFWLLLIFSLFFPKTDFS